jgi:subtilisin family serine protease
VLSGVARGSSVIAIQVFSRFSPAQCDGAAPCARSYVSDQVAALEYVYALRMTHDIAAVNLSLGGGRYESTGTCDSANRALKAAIDNLREAGVATVIAAGNGGYAKALSSPGCISSAVSVGAVTKDDVIPWWSSSASFLKLLAPGSAIVSSVPGGDYAYMSGTSMATPHVAGAFALLHRRDPSATVDAILARLRDTGRLIGDPRNGRSFPRIALAEALEGWGTASTISLTSLDSGETVTGGQRVTVTWSRAAHVAHSDVYFSRDGGQTWKRIARTRNGYFTWRTPTVKNAAACRVKVVAYDRKGKSLAIDKSAMDFWLEPRASS